LCEHRADNKYYGQKFQNFIDGASQRNFLNGALLKHFAHARDALLPESKSFH
jgi:hypothetical protein